MIFCHHVVTIKCKRSSRELCFMVKSQYCCFDYGSFLSELTVVLIHQQIFKKNCENPNDFRFFLFESLATFPEGSRRSW